MAFWVIYFSRDEKKRPLHSGPYGMEIQAQRYADKMIRSGSYDIIESKSRIWANARGEVLQKLVDKHHDMEMGSLRVSTAEKRNGKR